MDTNSVGNTRRLHHWHVAVLIPARNEEDLLPRCLASINRARRALPAGATSNVVIVSDGSTDRTFELASRLTGPEDVVLRSDAECVGVARAMAAGAALKLYDGDLSQCWLANTDADCEVPGSWLLDQLRLAQGGCTAVAGIVDVEDFAGHLPHVEHRFRSSYRVHADGSHPHVHGANLGVRADVYLRAGGWDALTTAEDHDLWERLGMIGASRQSLACLKVLTSGRRVGRAPLGFAQALAAHNDLAIA